MWAASGRNSGGCLLVLMSWGPSSARVEWPGTCSWQTEGVGWWVPPWEAGGLPRLTAPLLVLLCQTAETGLLTTASPGHQGSARGAPQWLAFPLDQPLHEDLTPAPQDSPRGVFHSQLRVVQRPLQSNLDIAQPPQTDSVRPSSLRSPGPFAAGPAAQGPGQLPQIRPDPRDRGVLHAVF